MGVERGFMEWNEVIWALFVFPSVLSDVAEEMRVGGWVVEAELSRFYGLSEARPICRIVELKMERRDESRLWTDGRRKDFQGSCKTDGWGNQDESYKKKN